MTDNQEDEQRAAQRQQHSVPVEFIVAEDLLLAQSIDLSADGIQFETERALEFEFKCKVDGREVFERARLLWMKLEDDGRCKFGLEFIPKKIW